jgi:hypothetical protein
MRDTVKGIDEFLRTDPLDAGCGRTMDLLHAYVELAASGRDPGLRFPDIAVHLSVCGPCADDFRELLAAVTG